MNSKKINRLEELNKLYANLMAPKAGDEIEFKLVGDDNFYKGKITSMKKKGKVGFEYDIESANAPGGASYQLEIIKHQGTTYHLTEEEKR